MNQSEVGEVLEQARNLQVATIGGDGFPHLTTLWFYMDDGLVTFRSFTKSQRVINLTRDPRLTVLAELGTDYEELRGVMIQGTAVLSTDHSLVMRTYAEVAKKMQGLAEIAPEDVAQRYGRFANKNTVIRVAPARLISWDHRKLSGSY